MVKLIKALREATGLPVYSNVSDESGECIIVSLRSSSDNGALKRQDVVVRIITKSARRGDEISTIIKRALLVSGDGSSVAGISDIRVVGGGSAWEPQTNALHTFVNLTYYERSEVL